MEPGVYYNIPDAEYHKIDAVSQSTVVQYRRSPAHARVPKNFAGSTLGTATHIRVLEPTTYDDRVFALPDLDLRFKAAKEAKEKLVAENPHKLILSAEDARCVEKMASAVHCNQTASAFLGRIEHTEITVIFDWNGVRCKARIDAATTDDYLLDLKTTQDASAQGFSKSVATFGYYCQAAMYLEAWKSLKRFAQGFIFICVEKDEPHGVACYELDAAAVGKGRAQLESALQIYASCKRYNYFPAYPDELRVLSLPQWALNEKEIPSSW